MGVVEEKVVLRSKLHLYILNVVVVVSLFVLIDIYIKSYENKNLDTDSLKCAYLLRSIIGVLYPQLKRCLSIIEQVMSLSYINKFKVI